MHLVCPNCGFARGATVLSSFRLQPCPACGVREFRTYLVPSAEIARPAGRRRRGARAESQAGGSRTPVKSPRAAV
jgi:predicted  nucleic acid-binding Zn-ribbon protein